MSEQKLCPFRKSYDPYEPGQIKKGFDEKFAQCLEDKCQMWRDKIPTCRHKDNPEYEGYCGLAWKP